MLICFKLTMTRICDEKGEHDWRQLKQLNAYPVFFEATVFTFTGDGNIRFTMHGLTIKCCDKYKNDIQTFA